MQTPKSRSMISVETFADILNQEVRDLSNILPLALRGEITTWQYDAKNCLSLYYRMKRGNIWSPRLFRALQAWATRLLSYSYELGFDAEHCPSRLVIGNASIHEGYYWVVNELKSLAMMRWQDFKASHFQVAIKMPIHLIKTGKIYCSLLHNQLEQYKHAVKYSTHLSGMLIISHDWVGDIALIKIIKKIEKAVKKHRNPKFRQHLVESMREKVYDRTKLRNY